jgi:mono/diheme cytochrome c family protein
MYDRIWNKMSPLKNETLTRTKKRKFGITYKKSFNLKSTFMNRKNILLAFLSGTIVLAVACNSNDKGKESSTSSTESSAPATTTESNNPNGIGPHQKVELTHPLDEKMIAQGENIYNVKCASCHKLTNEKLVGPGWKGVTDRRTPEWIMNFVTNTEEMLEKDTAAQNLLEVCLVKMPNQNLSEADARAVLEFQRKNDGKK